MWVLSCPFKYTLLYDFYPILQGISRQTIRKKYKIFEFIVSTVKASSIRSFSWWNCLFPLSIGNTRYGKLLVNDSTRTICLYIYWTTRTRFIRFVLNSTRQNFVDGHIFPGKFTFLNTGESSGVTKKSLLQMSTQVIW